VTTLPQTNIILQTKDFIKLLTIDITFDDQNQTDLWNENFEDRTLQEAIELPNTLTNEPNDNSLLNYEGDGTESLEDE